MNTWYSSQKLRDAFHNAIGPAKGSTMSRDPTYFPTPIALDRDADWDIDIASNEANAIAALILSLTYGDPIPIGPGRIVSRIPTPADGGVAPAFSGSMTISDLDPRIVYRVHGVYGIPEDQVPVAVKVTSPSNMTSVKALIGGRLDTTDEHFLRPKIFEKDSILVLGSETVAVDAALAVAGKIPCIVYFQEYGATPKMLQAKPASGRPQVDRSGKVKGGMMDIVQSLLR